MANSKDDVIERHKSVRSLCRKNTTKNEDHYIKTYEDKDKKVKGLICVRCKDEWLINSNDNFELHRSPLLSIWLMDLSDTGSYISWEKKMKEVLSPGDHVAWLRPFGFWHHAIVESVSDNTINVLEGTVRLCRCMYMCMCKCKCKCNAGVYRSQSEKGCYNLVMYRVNYSANIEKLNPPELVLMRARGHEGDIGWKFTSDNCEHFATFCKTGENRSNQIRNLGLSIPTWFIKTLVTSSRILSIAFISEKVEGGAETTKSFCPPRRKYCDLQWIGVILLIFLEIVYLFTVSVIIRRGSSQLDLRTNPKRRYRVAILKTCLQSVIILLCAILASTLVLNSIQKCVEGDEATGKGNRWSQSKKTALEIIFAVIGGMVGNSIGFILVKYIPWPCLRHDFIDNRGDETTPLSV